MIKRYSRKEISKIWEDENKYKVWQNNGGIPKFLWIRIQSYKYNGYDVVILSSGTTKDIENIVINGYTLMQEQRQVINITTKNWKLII